MTWSLIIIRLTLLQLSPRERSPNIQQDTTTNFPMINNIHDKYCTKLFFIYNEKLTYIDLILNL